MSQYTWVYCDQGQGSWALGGRGTRWWERQAARRAGVQARGVLALSTPARGARTYGRGVQRAQPTCGSRLVGRAERRRERGRGARLSARGRAG